MATSLPRCGQTRTPCSRASLYISTSGVIPPHLCSRRRSQDNHERAARVSYTILAVPVTRVLLASLRPKWRLLLMSGQI